MGHDVIVAIDDEDFLAVTGAKSGSWIFTAVLVDEDIEWMLNGNIVNITDYGIDITGDPEEGATIIVTNVHEIGENIAATDILDIVLVSE